MSLSNREWSAENAAVAGASATTLITPRVAIALAIFGVVSVVLAVVLSTGLGGNALNRAGYVAPGDNCTFITCPAGAVGPSGPPGQQGVMGPPGIQGVQGETGPQGLQGLPGPSGPMGQCLFHPACAIGPQGVQGIQGIPGPTGLAGLPGVTGPAGVAGPQGETGPQGVQGLQGLPGPIGPQGVPGICNCTALSMVNLINLGVAGTTELNGTVTLNGVMSCPGGALDISCFGLAACPDFSECVLPMQGARIFSTNGSVTPILYAGIDAGDQGNTMVLLGLPGGTSQVINTFMVNANGTFNMATTNVPMVMRSWFSNVLLESVGSLAVSTNIASSGTVTLTAPQAIYTSSMAGTIESTTGLTSIAMDGTFNHITVTAPLVNMTLLDWHVRKSAGGSWLDTQSGQTLTCQTAAPLPVVAGSSLYIPNDVIIGPGKVLMSNASDALVRMSGIELCGFLIRTESSTLQLQENTTVDVVDIRGIITNGSPVFPLTFNDAQGADFTDTAIHNSGTSGPLDCDDSEGFIVSNGTLYTNLVEPISPATQVLLTGDLAITSDLYTDSIRPYSGATVTLTGNLVVTGSISATTCLGCITSDERVKERVREVAPRTDLETILAMPRRIAFQYNRAYRATDRQADLHDTHHGFVAQELERVIPQAVVRTNHTLENGTLVSDFRRVLYDRVIPFTTGAIKELHIQQHVTELKHAALKKEHEILLAAHDKLTEEVATLRQAVLHLLDKIRT